MSAQAYLERLDDDIFRQAVVEHARVLGMDPDNGDAEFLWLAEEALLAQLPPEWEPCSDEEGNSYFYNHSTGESTWENPLDEPYRQLFRKLKNNPSGPSNGAPMSANGAWPAGYDRPKGSSSLARSAIPANSRVEDGGQQFGQQPTPRGHLVTRSPGLEAGYSSGGSTSMSSASTKRGPHHVPGKGGQGGGRRAAAGGRVGDSESDDGKVADEDETEEDLEEVGIDAQDGFGSASTVSGPLDSSRMRLSALTGPMATPVSSRHHGHSEHRQAEGLQLAIMPPAAPPVPVDDRGANSSIVAITAHRTVSLGEQGKDLQYSVRHHPDSGLQDEWISATLLLREVPTLVHSYNNRIVRTAETNKDRLNAAHAALEVENETLRSSVLELREHLGAEQREKERVSGDRSVLETLLSNVKVELGQELAANVEARKRIAQLESSLEQAQREAMKQADGATTTSSQRTAELEDQLESKDAELINAQEELFAAKRKISRAENESELLRTALENLKTQTQSHEGELEQRQADAKQREAEIKHLKEQLRKQALEHDQQRVERDQEAQSLEENLMAQLRELRTQLNAREKELKLAREQISDQAQKQLERGSERELEVQAELDRARSDMDELQEASNRREAQLRTDLEHAREKLSKAKEALAREEERHGAEERSRRDELAQLEEQVREAGQHRVTALEADLAAARADANKAAATVAVANRELEVERARVAELDEELCSKSARVSELEDALERQCKETDRAIGANSDRVKAESDAKLEALQKENESLKQVEAKLTRELDLAKEALAELRAACDLTRVADLERKAAQVDFLQAEAERLREKANGEARKRRALHNQLVDLQGNIRVYCRVRPVLEHERKSGQAGVVVDLEDEGEVALRQSHASRDQEDRFEFDQVFAPESSQAQVFDQVEPLALSALDGYNVCIFAYGQTGSGKTYTMDGSTADRGVTHRTFETLFSGIEERQKAGLATYTVELSVLEIYNETIRDLLVIEDSNKPRPLVSTPKPKKLEVRQGEHGLHVPGLTHERVSCVGDVEALMQRGTQNRTVGAHNVNLHSSRSHLVVTVSLVADHVHGAKRFTTRSKLHLIDLAGSERLDKTNAAGAMLQEAKAINKSLSALGNVIKALGKQQQSGQHVPFRDSKLTFLLQDSLSGSSKVLMFVNISPVEWNAPESLCSLTFAARCRKTALGAAKKNTESAQVAALKRQIEDLQGGSRRR